MLASNGYTRNASRKIRHCGIGRVENASQGLPKKIDATKHRTQTAKSLLYFAHTVPKMQTEVVIQAQTKTQQKYMG